MTELIELVDLQRDLDALADLEAISFRNPWTRQMLNNELAGVDCALAYVVRTSARRVAAYCTCRLIADELHLSNLAVHPECRRQGMARRLLRHLLLDAAGRGARRATLEVRASNDPARQLYARAGFEERGTRPGYYTLPGEDAVILWREPL